MRCNPLTRAAAAALFSLCVIPAASLADSGARFSVTQPPQGMGEQAGEPTLGFNPNTGRVMFIAGVETLRVTFPDNFVEKLPEACDAQWENKSAPNTSVISFDPILFTDRGTGRTFVSQLLIAAGESAFAYTDDDGDTWVPSPATLSGGIDHQSVGGGPYSTLVGNPAYPHSVFYCSQSLAESFCIRSDDGGLSFGPPAPLSGATGCSAIHGHVKVDSEGVAYVPVPSCGGTQALMTSTNDGISWASRPVGASSGKSSNNPALAIATDNTLYFCYQDIDGHPRATVSHDKGMTWENDFDLGEAAGIQTAEFPVAVAGDPDRAACGFLGTTTEGNGDAMDFEGIWHPYVAVTYDGGKTWSLSNVSPDDPVQGAGGLHEGGAGPINRNLLDFNDMDVDGEGRVLMGYADGCIDGCRLDPSQNSYSARATVARQSGGKRMFAQFDPANTGKPAAACLTPKSARDSKTALLKWRAPDNGGAEISGYKIFRGASAGQLKQVAQVTNGLAFNDNSAAAAPGEEFYGIVAINKNGDGVASNVLKLPVGQIPLRENACVAPGITLLKDPAGDSRDKLPMHDVQQVNVAEPPDMDGKLVITMKIGDLSALPPSTLWEVRFAIDDTNSFFVGMETTQGTPRFVYGHIGITVLVVTSASAYTIDGDLDPASNYTPDGTITLVLDKSKLAGDFEVKPGRRLVMAAFARALAGNPVNSAGTSFDPSGSNGYYFRDADCSSLSSADLHPPAQLVTAPVVVAAPVVAPPVAVDKGRFGGALNLLLLLPLLGFAVSRRR